MSFALNDEFGVENDEFRIQNDELCIQNDDFSLNVMASGVMLGTARQHRHRHMTSAAARTVAIFSRTLLPLVRGNGASTWMLCALYIHARD